MSRRDGPTECPLTLNGVIVDLSSRGLVGE